MKLAQQELKIMIQQELKNVLKEASSRSKTLEDYIGIYKPGMLRVFHYTSVGNHSAGNTMVVDPERFGKQSYTKGDFAVSGFKRSFWYVDLEDVESTVVQGNLALFYYDIPANEMYNWQKDPDGMYKKHRHKIYSRLEWDNFFQDMKDNYTGIYYRLGYKNEPIVVTFKPIVAKKTTAEEQASILSGDVPQ